jgi:hypothetical protein
MAQAVSIRERIERRIRDIVAAIDGVGTAYRWDARGLVHPDTDKLVDENSERLTMHNGDAMVIADDEGASEGGEGNIGWTEKVLPIEVYVTVRQDEDDEETSATLHNRWIYKLEKALMTDPYIHEVDGGGEQTVRLAIDSRVTDASSPPVVDEQREFSAVIRIEVTYQHNRNDPAVGPGVTLLEE